VTEGPGQLLAIIREELRVEGSTRNRYLPHGEAAGRTFRTGPYSHSQEQKPSTHFVLICVLPFLTPCLITLGLSNSPTGRNSNRVIVAFFSSGCGKQTSTHGCHGAVVEEMLGGKPIDVPEHYAQASAINMLPLGIPQVLIWGRNDDIAPIWLGRDIRSRRNKPVVRLVSIPDVGHFEIASPLATTWPAVRSEIVALLAKQP